jgi:hypothetical protein
VLLIYGEWITGTVRDEMHRGRFLAHFCKGAGGDGSLVPIVRGGYCCIRQAKKFLSRRLPAMVLSRAGAAVGFGASAV